MPIKYGSHINPSSTPQTAPIPGKDMKQNNAGGYSFTLDKWKTLERFIIIGAENGSYYCKEEELSLQSGTNLLACIKEDGPRTVQVVRDLSVSKRAVKNLPAIFALAMCTKYGDLKTRSTAFDAVNSVCRTGYDLFMFVEYAKQINKGWGRGFKRAISEWYTTKEPNKLAYQVAKYQQRNGWSNKDLIKLSHPKPKEQLTGSIIRWVLGKEDSKDMILPRLLVGFEAAKVAKTEKEIAKYITTYKLPWECIPTQFLKSPIVWSALVNNSLPLGALVRNLGRMTANGTFSDFTNVSKVVGNLRNSEYVRQSGLHPVNVLIALRTYESGRGDKGSLTWTPVPAIIAALNDTFYLAFENVPTTGKAFFIGLDVSGSMGAYAAGKSSLNCREAGMALIMPLVKKEQNCQVFGFTSGSKNIRNTVLTSLPVHSAMSLKEAIGSVENLPFGSTDCSLPIEYAIQNNIYTDCFIVITDNETYMGKRHVSQALKEYRDKINPKAKMIVMGMIPTNFTICDPTDFNSLDIVGFDSSVPALISEFVKM